MQEPDDEDDEDDEEDSDEEGHNVFYKAEELIVSVTSFISNLFMNKLTHFFFVNSTSQRVCCGNGYESMESQSILTLTSHRWPS